MNKPGKDIMMQYGKQLAKEMKNGSNIKYETMNVYNNNNGRMKIEGKAGRCNID